MISGLSPERDVRVVQVDAGVDKVLAHLLDALLDREIGVWIVDLLGPEADIGVEG